MPSSLKQLRAKSPLKPTVELLENRTMLSASPAHGSKGARSPKLSPTYILYKPHVTSRVTGRANKRARAAHHAASPAGSSSTAVGLTPTQIRTAYGIGAVGLSSITFNGVQGDGSGQTIALIDAYNDPNIGSDLAAFDANYTLPAPPSFEVLNEEGGTSLPQNAATGSGSGNWGIEESLDVEWAHVIAPEANIILFEADTNSGDDLYTAAQTAAATAGVSTVSMSFASDEYFGETGSDSSFTTPSGHTGVTFLASTGDSASQVSYPATSPNVIAVGGTSLYLTGSNTYSSESAWSSGGGGPSADETQPSYQSGAISSAYRTTPDVAIDADPNTGVGVYDSFDEGTNTPWIQVGGTSLSSPMWAGLVTVADQGRVAEGLAPLDGPSQTLVRLYQLAASNFHDITTGSNGHKAVAGYDEATGIGTPVANLLIPDLAGAASVTGRVFVDNTGSGVYGGSDTPVAAAKVYLDLNNDGVLDNGDPTATTSAQGIYSFTDQPAGGTVRLLSTTPAGYVAVPPSSAVITFGNDTINLTYFPITFSTTTAGATYTVQSDATNTNEQILINGSLAYSVAESVLSTSTLSFNLTGAGDSLTVNAANASPAVAGISLTGASGGDPLTVLGTALGNDAFAVTSSSISFDGVPISFSNVSLLTLSPGAGLDSLVVNSGSVSIAAPGAGQGIVTRNFSKLNISSAATALFATAAAHADRQVVETASLSAIGQLDLGGNDMIIHNGNLGSITSLLATGYAGGSWNGTGIASAVAHGDSTHLTALGSTQSTGNSFDGMNTSNSDVLIKYTYYGDTNLDGKIDGIDYSRIDGGFFTAATGWANGDFNYDNHVDGSDYTLIDNAFNTQGTAM
jgi:hypothetical protein